MTKTHGVIVGAAVPEENLYAGDAFKPVLEQTRTITGQSPAKAIVNRGYRGHKEVDGTEALLLGKPNLGQSKRESTRRPVAIESLFSHLQHQCWLMQRGN